MSYVHVQTAIMVLLLGATVAAVEASVNRTAYTVAHPKKTLLQQLHLQTADGKGVQRSLWSAAQLDAVPIEWAMMPAGLTPTQPGDQEWKVLACNLCLEAP